jgi:hypothetical protein
VPSEAQSPKAESPARTISHPESPAPIKPSTSPSGGSVPSTSSTTLQADIENLWSQLLEAVGRASPFLKTYLLESHPVGLNRNAFTIGFDPEFKDHLSLVDNPRNRTILETKLQELGLREASIRFVQAPAPANHPRRSAEQPSPSTNSSSTVTAVPAGAPTEPARSRLSTPLAGTLEASPGNSAALPASKEDFKNDPLIRKALEIFKGAIVEVRS